MTPKRKWTLRLLGLLVMVLVGVGGVGRNQRHRTAREVRLAQPRFGNHRRGPREVGRYASHLRRSRHTRSWLSGRSPAKTRPATRQRSALEKHLNALPESDPRAVALSTSLP